MSEELKRGIPKARPTGEKKEYTAEEKEQHDQDFEKILKEYGVLKKNESIKDMKHPEQGCFFNVKNDDLLDYGVTQSNYCKINDLKGSQPAVFFICPKQAYDVKTVLNKSL